MHGGLWSYRICAYHIFFYYLHRAKRECYNDLVISSPIIHYRRECVLLLFDLFDNRESIRIYSMIIFVVW